MEIFESTAGHSAVVHVSGRINSVNASALGDRLQTLLEQGCRAIVIDCSHLEHMTSAGFRSLLRADRDSIDRGARLVLCGLQGLTLELFEIGGFLDMFTVAQSRDDASRIAAG